MRSIAGVPGDSLKELLVWVCVVWRFSGAFRATFDGPLPKFAWVVRCLWWDGAGAPQRAACKREDPLSRHRCRHHLVAQTLGLAGHRLDGPQTVRLCGVGGIGLAIFQRAIHPLGDLACRRRHRFGATAPRLDAAIERAQRRSWRDGPLEPPCASLGPPGWHHAAPAG